ncbi:MAG: anti-sigma F factor antagonist [Candidatus Reconcilbacillus cellulovorans]|uniref:Anti-sigma F factor antagonist n=1 Tax=Candidatus Reconcilbacillus cellulovorans TaxID=1906605 RepID=A0A2A6E045_9BACL|nr:MAG: anti-sigma F factor antagonist [Candidatus Reconcilbacillus cellulovorans]
MGLEVELERRRGALIVRLGGELDHHTAGEVRARIDSAMARGDTRDLVLSLKNLTFMDSSGIGVVLGRYRQLARRGGRLVICDVSPAVLRLFELSGLLKILAVEENVERALSRLEGAS